MRSTYERQKHNNKRFFLPGPKEARTLGLFCVSVLPSVDSAGRLFSSKEDFLRTGSLLVMLWIVGVGENVLSCGVMADMAGLSLFHRSWVHDVQRG